MAINETTISEYQIKYLIIKMSKGNPGAIYAMCEVIGLDPKVNPFEHSAGPSAIVRLYRLEIYGSDIYVLWNDICERNTPKMVLVLIANQLGLISDQVLKDACHRQDRSGRNIVPVDELCYKVLRQFPVFYSNH